MALFQTDKHDYTTVDDRVWQHPGAVVDIGCDPWDWSRCFIGKKRVIGADPFTTPLPGTELFKGVLGTMHGTTHITCEGDASTILFPAARSIEVPMITWKEFKEIFRLEQIAVLKLNIEGAEYSLLHDLDAGDLAQIDQIVVSFHHWRWPAFTEATKNSLLKLTNAGFKMQQTNALWCWWLGLR